MLKNLFFILFLLISNLLFAQEWTEPVNISNMEGHDSYPDMAIDSNGVIHCVWKHEINNDYIKIYYSKSEDDGITWSTPEDISLNNEKKCGNPRIATDSDNNIYAVYEYNTGNYYETLFHLRKNNGISWGDSIIVNQDYPGAYMNRISIDNNNRVYIFWSFQQKIHYRYLENDTSSETFCPYDDDNWYFLEKAIADKNNMLHCVGSFLTDGLISNDTKLIYFTYDPDTDSWSQIKKLSIKHVYPEDKGIDLDENGYPHVIWHEETTNTPHATLYAYYDGTDWSELEIIAEDSYNPMVKVINGKEYLVNAVEDDDSYNLVVYSKDIYDNWFGTIIYPTDMGGHNDFEKYNGKLYLLITDLTDQNGLEIYLMKHDISTGIEESQFECPLKLCVNSPNPFSESTQFNYTLNTSGYTSLKIYDLKGQLKNILVNKKQQVGNYSVTWNGTDHNGNKLPPGIYLYRLSLDNYRITKSLIIN